MHNEIYKFRKLKLETSFFRRQGATHSDSASGPQIYIYLYIKSATQFNLLSHNLHWNWMEGDSYILRIRFWFQSTLK